MKTESTPFVRAINPGFPRTPLSFRQLITVRTWHSVAAAAEPAITPRNHRLARPIAARLRPLGFLGLLAAGLFFGGAARAVQSVSISWNPSTNAGIAGYIFYRGTNSGVYTSQFNVGTNTAITLTGLPEGQMDYFSVAAYDGAGVTSPNSTQITYLVPGLQRLVPPTGPGKTASLTFSGASGHSYNVQASSNLVTWTTIWSSGALNSNGWVTFQDPQSSTLSQRFYRLIMN
jgi:hypothetical protein